MSVILFYEKVGCVNNTKQKKMLTNLGYKLISINLLETKFKRDELLKFFGDKNIKACINKNAPKIKYKEIDIDNFSDNEILEMMINEPILIKRPLLAIGDKKFCGFEEGKILSFLNSLKLVC